MKFEETESIVVSIIKNISFKDIMLSQYGNYFCTELISLSNDKLRKLIFQNIKEDFFTIATNSFGTHSIQRLIDLSSTKEEEILLLEYFSKNRENILPMAFDVNATHSIQKLISTINEENRSDLNRLIIDNINKLAVDVNGICVIKYFILGNKSEEIRLEIIERLSSSFPSICVDQYGNYAVQYILQTFKDSLNCIKKLIKAMKRNIIELSTDKYASNAVETAIDILNGEERLKFIFKIFNSNKVYSLAKNKFGQFVLKKAVSFLNEEIKESLRLLVTTKINRDSNTEKQTQSFILVLSLLR